MAAAERTAAAPNAARSAADCSDAIPPFATPAALRDTASAPSVEAAANFNRTAEQLSASSARPSLGAAA